MDQKANKTTCMACSCPCKAHTEHNHPVDEGKKTSDAQAGGTCSTCETQEAGSTCGCK